MTPGARAQAAIEVLDAVLRGAPAERELTRWARGARYAGSKDRAAVRDLVFDALRRLRSSAWLGGQGDVAVAEIDARRVMLGLLRGRGEDVGAWFTGIGHAPASPAPDEVGPSLDGAPEAVRADLPDAQWARLRADLGDRAAAVAEALRARAPVQLRANRARVSAAGLVTRLAEEGIVARVHPTVATAVEVEGAPRGLDRSAAFEAGLFEMQDAGSQLLVERLPLDGVTRVLDLCAGGGGKALALAARAPDLEIVAHDADPKRLSPLAARSVRAGARIATTARPEAGAPWDMVIADVPCSGSGAWRRQPEARWRLTKARLEALVALQTEIAARAVALTREGGFVAYMTCSLFRVENDRVVDAQLSGEGGLEEVERVRTDPAGRSGNTDGFFLSVLRRGAGRAAVRHR